MQPYPVRYRVDYPNQLTRLQLLIRLAAFCALAILGISAGAVLGFAFLALPVFAAIRLNNRGPSDYLSEDGPRLARLLGWFAAVNAWAGLTTDRLPAQSPDETVRLEIEARGRPTPASAMWRILYGLPSALVLAFLTWLGGLVWLWTAVRILVSGRIGPVAFEYLVGLQRWHVRLLAYQASLVDEYPPFSFADQPPTSLGLTSGVRPA